MENDSKSGRIGGAVAIVTGGGTGIGRAIALAFAREGANVCITGRTEEKLRETSAEIERAGGEAIYVRGDVSVSRDAQQMIGQTLDRYGRIDILVNNAGVRASICTAVELEEEEWDRTFDIDVKGSWLCSKYCLPSMMEQRGGSIIMIASISAHIGQRKQGCYNAAKAAQEGLMKSMAVDFAPYGIRVNSICPAWIETEMNRAQLREMRKNPHKSFEPGYTMEMLEGQLHPLGRLGQPSDCVGAALYLACDESSWVTGTSLVVDGGYLCQ